MMLVALVLAVSQMSGGGKHLASDSGATQGANKAAGVATTEVARGMPPEQREWGECDDWDEWDERDEWDECPGEWDEGEKKKKKKGKKKGKKEQEAKEKSDVGGAGGGGAGGRSAEVDDPEAPFEIVKELVHAGAAIDLQNKWGVAAVQMAQNSAQMTGLTDDKTHLEITTILEKASREQEEEAGCVCDGDADTYDGDTVQEGEDEKVSSESKLKLMMAAAIRGDELDIVKELIAKGHDVRTVDEHNATGLITASSAGFTGIVMALLKADPSVEHVRMMNNDGVTALTMASQEGHANVVRALLKADSAIGHVRLVDNIGSTSLMQASHAGYADIVRELLEADPAVEHVRMMIQKSQHAALTLASSWGHEDVVTIKAGLCHTIMTSYDSYDTALTLATKGGHTAVTWLLMEADVAGRQNLYSTTVGILTLAAVLFSAAYNIMKHCKAQKQAWSAEHLMREARWEHAQQENSDDQVRQRRTAKAIAAARRAAEKTEREEKEKSKKTAKKRNKGKLKKEADERKKGEEEKEAKQQSHDERQRKEVELRRKWATLAGMAMQHHAAEQRNTKQVRQARRHARREAQRQEAAAARAVAAEGVTAMEDKSSEFPNETGKSKSKAKSKATNATTTAPTAEDSECVYCMDAQKEAACVPCGHRGCMTCLTVTVDALTNGCPTCRATCREIIRLY